MSMARIYIVRPEHQDRARLVIFEWLRRSPEAMISGGALGRLVDAVADAICRAEAKEAPGTEGGKSTTASQVVADGYGVLDEMRDWLAGQALGGLMASDGYSEEHAARLAYRMADAMLRVRSETPDELRAPRERPAPTSIPSTGVPRRHP
jgi:hypothetical protein